MTTETRGEPATAAGLYLYHGIALRGQEQKAARSIIAIEQEAMAAGLPDVERFMVVLRPWLGIANDVELERACRSIRAALATKAPE
jgi:hypothetical protein